jgi:hypothetical protein
VQSVDEAKVAVGKLLDKGCKQVIITLGASGVVFASQDNCIPIHVPTKTVKPVDSTVSPSSLMSLLNPMKLKLVQIIFKNSVCTSKKTQDFFITKTSWLMLFKEIITAYFENRTKSINTLCEQNAELMVSPSGTYSYH